MSDTSSKVWLPDVLMVLYAVFIVSAPFLGEEYTLTLPFRLFLMQYAVKLAESGSGLPFTAHSYVLLNVLRLIPSSRASLAILFLAKTTIPPVAKSNL